MPLTRLKSLLDEGGLAPDNVDEMARISEAHFRSKPSLAAFVLRSIFEDLATAWSDSQGVPLAQHQPYEAMLLPKLKTLVISMIVENVSTDHLEVTVKALCDCHNQAAKVRKG